MLNMTTEYLMESHEEAERLELKDNSQNTRDQLVATDIYQYFRDGSCIVEAGAGVGVVSVQIAELVKESGTSTKQILLDASDERLEVAKRHMANYANEKAFIKCDLENIPLPDRCVDYLFCRFVFEYLPNPERVYSELVRLMKPGGKLVIGDLDNNSMTHYPLAEELDAQLNQIIIELNKKFSFDPNVGRKLYSYFYKHQFNNIKVHLFPHHLFYGDLKSNDLYNWNSKLDRLIDLQRRGKINLDFSVQDFGIKFMQFLKSKERFSYTPLILVEGTAP